MHTDRDAQASRAFRATPEELLFKLYQEETVTVYPPAPILFKCRCSRERSADAIALLPNRSAQRLLPSKVTLR
ncbi:MAG: hypothetical protein CM15mP74_25930 [Halieaceae bacterium]|nr:MAG: hypothetical protein CM15mP74_25930 [Halieaceae bacterium]